MKNQRLIIAAVVVVVLVIGAAIILAKSNTSKTASLSSSPSVAASASMSMAPTTTPTPSPTAAVISETPLPPSATPNVTIQAYAFIPQQITVKAGTKVTWTNTDTVGHTITETDGQPGPASGTLSKGQSYSFTYTTAGTYQYHCSIHSEMTGAVIVTQ